MVVEHSKGSHTSSPFVLKFFNKPKIVSFLAEFKENCKYNHGDADQGDWNKLTGVTFGLIDARKNTLMCGWRYNLETGMFELCGYYHRKGSFEPPSQPLCSVSANEPFYVNFIFDKSNGKAIIEIHTKEGKFQESKEFYEFGLARQVNTWFGGNKAAPQDMTIYLTRL